MTTPDASQATPPKAIGIGDESCDSRTWRLLTPLAALPVVILGLGRFYRDWPDPLELLIPLSLVFAYVVFFKSLRRPFTWGNFLVWSAVGLVPPASYALSHMNFAAGRICCPLFDWAVCVVYPVLLIVATILWFEWHRREATVLQLVAGIALMMVLLVVSVASICESFYWENLGLRLEVQRDYGVDKLTVWADEQMSKPAPDDGQDRWIWQGELPDGLTATGCRSAIVQYDRESRPTRVQFNYGGGFAHWGIIVSAAVPTRRSWSHSFRWEDRVYGFISDD